MNRFFVSTLTIFAVATSCGVSEPVATAAESEAVSDAVSEAPELAADLMLPEGQKIGEDLELRPLMPLSMVQSEPRKYFEQTLHVEGTIQDVCQKKGCWMSIQDAGEPTIVRWETGCGGKFAFPTDWVGKRVVVQGSFYPKELSAADREHMEEEAGKELHMPADLYEMNASAVVLLDSE